MDLPFVKEAVKGLFSKTSCEMYPFVPSEAAPRYRGRIVFHPEKCINCGMCERVCAGGAIKTESVPVEGGPAPSTSAPAPSAATAPISAMKRRSS